MSIALVAPSTRRSSVLRFAEPDLNNHSSSNSNGNGNSKIAKNKGIRRSQTFTCCPPAAGISRSNSHDLKRTPTNSNYSNHNYLSNSLKRVSTFGLGLKRPRRTRTGILHFEPQPQTNGLIISGYTCIGKTSFRRKVSLKNKHVLRVVDLDSSAYSRAPDFPDNYIAAIRQCANERSIVLISTHDAVAARLEEEGYYVALVYPEGSAANKQEWLRRLQEREEGGRDSRLYKIVDENWEVWDQHLRRCPVSKKVALSHKDYLISVFKDIYKDYFQQVVIH